MTRKQIESKINQLTDAKLNELLIHARKENNADVYNDNTRSTLIMIETVARNRGLI